METPNLTELDISYCQKIEELDIKEGLKRLTALKLCSTENPKIAIKLLKSAPNLKEINITNIKNPESILAWINKHPHHFTKALTIISGLDRFTIEPTSKKGKYTDQIPRKARPSSTVIKPLSSRTATTSHLKRNLL